MAEGKWIRDLAGDTPLIEAARRVLTVRLEVVRDYLPRAVRESERDPEYIHQLRVGTRRAGAALRIFAACLPSKVYRHVRKQLRTLRRAAGAARDWDVFRGAVTSWKPPHRGRCQAGLDFLVGYAVGQRVVAQEQLHAVCPEPPAPFDRLLTETVRSVQQPEDRLALRTLADLARPLLSGQVRELEHAVAQDLDDYEHLHQVRILGKRLRYAMEVFADCFAPAFREELYPAVEEMQEILGNANDSHVASQRLQALRTYLQATQPAEWQRFKLGIEAYLRYHQRRLPRERQHFLTWWQSWREKGGEAALERLVRSPLSRAGSVSDGESARR